MLVDTIFVWDFFLPTLLLFKTLPFFYTVFFFTSFYNFTYILPFIYLYFISILAKHSCTEFIQLSSTYESITFLFNSFDSSCFIELKSFDFFLSLFIFVFVVIFKLSKDFKLFLFIEFFYFFYYESSFPFDKSFINFPESLADYLAFR